ncbi:hypothetical protein BJX61DRAFT_312753 [Aspergillus egyptiacus]|nr:hypothetical protein BJX61DRAFT_312753 [Aspergillus egyptiacus]
MPSQVAHKPFVPPAANSAGVNPGTSPVRVPRVGGRSQNRQRDVDANLRVTGTPFLSPPSSHRGHTRSVSQPFASPSTRTGRRRNKSISLDADLDSDDDDDDDIYVPNVLSTSPRKGVPRPPPKDDLTTGKCAVCNSTVRWPRNLKVFRCTECLTVNDLEPYQDSKDFGTQENSKKDFRSHQQVIPRKAVPITVERTKAILDRSIHTYLRDRLEQPPVPSKDELENWSAGGQAVNLRHPSTKPPGYLPVRQHPRARGRSVSPADVPVKTGKTDGGDRTFGSSSCSRAIPENGPDNRIPFRSVEPRDLGRPRGNDRTERQRYVFRELEEYIISGFKGCDILNASFKTAPAPAPFSPDDRPEFDAEKTSKPMQVDPIVELDAKTLLAGDLAENSSWWMVDDDPPGWTGPAQTKHKRPRTVSSRSPRINWDDVEKWYHMVLAAGTSWVDKWSAMRPSPDREEQRTKNAAWDAADLNAMQREITESRIHLHRTLLKATENLLKRPRRPLKRPDDIRFLLILLANPLLYPPSPELANLTIIHDDMRLLRPCGTNKHRHATSSKPRAAKTQSVESGHHPGIVKRILGLLANLPNDCHHYLVSWFSRFSVGQFEKTVELVNKFVTYRLSRQHMRRRSEPANEDSYLVPSLSSSAMTAPAELHAAISGRNEGKQKKDKQDTPRIYSEDWQIRGAGRVMALLFAANNTEPLRKPGPPGQVSTFTSGQQRSERGHLVPISSFYNTRLDYSNLVVADFEAWESRTTKFSFCQYPFFLSIGAKIQILEHDARRQMEVKAREAFFSSILTRKAVSQYFVLKVRRDCLVEDSLQRVSEVVGSSPEEMKKGLRIGFVGEEGVDAGGLRKEWFLLLVREVFDPHHGLFIYDEDSQYCYFNPFCLESSEQFFLVGVVLGLAIYNSIILDIALPPFAFKKLLAAAPQTTGPQPLTARPTYKCSLDDLAEYRPALARGLRMLLDFEGDVAETFCHTFVADIDRYGDVVTIPLCAGGENKPVTNANRREFVDLFVQYHLDTAVTRQFEPFRRGFFSVCGGNALSLFRPEEIELLVRGSDEPLDVRSLRAVATYLNWSTQKPELVPVVQWFWDYFERTKPEAQRKILSFITSSDRIPAMGATSLNIQLVCLGEDSPRFPTAHTCFNRLGLYRYATREKFERLLSEAVLNSEGFGLK